MKPGNNSPSKLRAIRTKVRVQQLAHGRGMPLPCYQSAGAAGIDLPAALGESETLMLRPGQRCAVPTGLALEIPPGFEAQIRPRSGLAFRHGVTVLNSPGTIDSDYRGEIKVLLINLGESDFVIARGERIAQMVLAPVCQANLVNVVVLNDSERGAGGFGSTGTKTNKAPAKASNAKSRKRAATTAKRTVAKSKPLAKKKAKTGPAKKRAASTAASSRKRKPAAKRAAISGTKSRK